VFPLFLKLAGRRVLVVGGGRVATAKVRQLRASGAHVTVVAPEVAPELARDVEDPEMRWVRRTFVPADLEGAWLVVSAASREVNRSVAAAAEQRHVFVNAADDPAAASAYLGGVVRRGTVTLAVSTDGLAPALAGLLREALERLLPDDVDRWVEVARGERETWKAQGTPHAERRPLLLTALNTLYADRPEGAP